jgi:hypothetical protein
VHKLRVAARMLVHDVRWLYPRPVTTLAVLTVAMLMTLLGRALLPETLRPPGPLPVVAATLMAYVALRLGAFTQWTKRFKHSVLDWFGGDVDDAQTWLLAALSGGTALVLIELLRRAVSA